MLETPTATTATTNRRLLIFITLTFVDVQGKSRRPRLLWPFHRNAWLGANCRSTKDPEPKYPDAENERNRNREMLNWPEPSNDRRCALPLPEGKRLKLPSVLALLRLFNTCSEFVGRHVLHFLKCFMWALAGAVLHDDKMLPNVAAEWKVQHHRQSEENACAEETSALRATVPRRRNRFN
jgi:hypothetical protein